MRLTERKRWIFPPQQQPGATWMWAPLPDCRAVSGAVGSGPSVQLPPLFTLHSCVYRCLIFIGTSSIQRAFAGLTTRRAGPIGLLTGEGLSLKHCFLSLIIEILHGEDMAPHVYMWTPAALEKRRGQNKRNDVFILCIHMVIIQIAAWKLRILNC